MKYLNNKEVLEAFRNLNEEKREEALGILVKHFEIPLPPDQVQQKKILEQKLARAEENEKTCEQNHAAATRVVEGLKERRKAVGEDTPKGLELQGDIREKQKIADRLFNETMSYREERKKLKKQLRSYTNTKETDGFIAWATQD